jgi:hypothetical protein
VGRSTKWDQQWGEDRVLTADPKNQTQKGAERKEEEEIAQRDRDIR